MDSLLIIGNVDPKLMKFMQKAGYMLHTKSDSRSIPEIIRDEVIDIILIEDSEDKQVHEWIEFLRQQESTKQVPIVALAADKLQTLQVREQGYEKVELLQMPYSLGTILAKVATMLRVRKMVGLKDNRATLADVNVALRDLNERHRTEVHEAQSIQNALLPKDLPVDDRFDVAVCYDPLEDVGGDFYMVEKRPSGALQLLSTDVTGHGLAAAFIGSMTKLAYVAVNKDMPGDLLQGMNALMAPVVPQGRFVTANAFLYDPSTQQLYIARAGGPQAALLKQSTREILCLKGEGFPLGFFEEGEYPTTSIPMEAGDVLVVVTDGLTEAQNRKKQFFGFDGIAAALEQTAPTDSAQQILESLKHSFKTFLDGRVLKDDVTILIMKAASA